MKTKKMQFTRELLFIHELNNSDNLQNYSNRERLGSSVIDEQHDIRPAINSVVNDADRVQFCLMDGREFEAKVKGADPHANLVANSIDDGQSTVAEPACSWTANNDKKSWI